jgi:hypothetical protein
MSRRPLYESLFGRFLVPRCIGLCWYVSCVRWYFRWYLIDCIARIPTTPRSDAMLLNDKAIKALKHDGTQNENRIIEKQSLLPEPL